MKKIISISFLILVLLSKTSGLSQQANCNNLHLDTDTFYLSFPQDTIVDCHLFYFDSVAAGYPFLGLTLADTSIISPLNYLVLNSLYYGDTMPLNYFINFKTSTFLNNTVVNGLIHVFDTGILNDTILNCFLPIVIILQNVTGISEMEDNTTIKIYPNPAYSELNIQNNFTQAIQFTLYNIQGKKLIDKILINKTNAIDLSSYSNGIYFYKLTSYKGTIKTGKIIKQQ